MHQCEEHIEVYTNYDPTRTTSLRNEWVRKMNGRFDELTTVIRKAVVVKDCFGLKRGITTQQMTEPPANAFAFEDSRQKVEAFMRWLRHQVDTGILTLAQYRQLRRGIEQEWTDRYVYDSYRRGVLRARHEMLVLGLAILSIEASGGIDNILSTPPHSDRLALLYARIFGDLQKVTDTMSGDISRVLTQSFLTGDGPVIIADKLRAVIDGTNADELGITDTLGRHISAKKRAEMIARTEVIRAFHLAAIQEYRNWGILGIRIKVEWRTAGDARVCEQCAPMEGQVFTLDEIEGMIPVHPNCRCLALPVII